MGKLPTRLVLFVTMLVTLTGCDRSRVQPVQPTSSPRPTTAVATTVPTPSSTATSVLTPGVATPFGNITETIQATVTPAQIESRTLRRFSFADAEHGWMVSASVSGQGTILTTADGGKTWTDRANVDQVLALDAISPTNAAILSNGTLLLTADGSEHWQAQTTAIQTIVAVDFSDAQHGWVLGYGGGEAGLYRTTDGGQTWEKRGAPSHGRRLSFVSATTGWVLCEEGGAMGRTARSLYRTIDAGQTWELMAATPYDGGGTLPNTSGVAAFFFRTETDGWLSLVGGAIATTDGGRTWQRINLPKLEEDPSSIPLDFLSRQQGYAVIGGVQTRLLATEDGGATWMERYATALWPSLGLTMVDQTHGFAAGATTDAGAILATTDKGYTWRQIGTIGADVGRIARLAFSDRSHGWATTTRDQRDGSMTCAFYRTRDGGANWQALPAPPGDQCSYAYASFDFVDSATGYLALREGDNARLFTTRDGGESFQPVGLIATSPLLDVQPPHIQFFSVREGWANIAGDLLSTSDGGRSWTPLPKQFRPAPGAPDRILVGSLWPFPAGSSWLTVGVFNPMQGESMLLKTENGGQTWTRFAFPKPAPACFGASVFIDPDHGWLVQPGHLCYTTDSGRSWTQIR